MKRPLSSRLREIRDRLDFIGDDADVETLNEAVKLAERAERELAEAGQGRLVVDRFGPLIELREDGHWYRDGERVPVEEAGRLDQAIRPVTRGDLLDVEGGKARTTDPDTSHEAARRAADRQGSQRHVILTALVGRPEGMTAEALADATGLPYVSVSTRVTELVKREWLAVIDERETTTGTKAQVVAFAPGAQDEFEQIEYDEAGRPGV